MTRTMRDDAFDLDDLLHPASAFDSPSDVVADPDLTIYEKRAILASWASDACALEAAPELREPVRGKVVRFDDIIDALRALDDRDSEPLRTYQRKLRRRSIFGRQRGADSTGSSAR